MGSSHTILSERTYDYLLYTKDVTAFYDEGNIWDETKIHTYSMYKEGDEEHYGVMLMGMESDTPMTSMRHRKRHPASEDSARMACQVQTRRRQCVCSQASHYMYGTGRA